VPPHWWIPLKASDAKARKEEIRKIVEDEANGVLEGFWEDEDANRLYALAMDIDLTSDRQGRMRTDGPPIKLHTKPLKKV
jgi:hypothetical protein